MSVRDPNAKTGGGGWWCCPCSANSTSEDVILTNCIQLNDTYRYFWSRVTFHWGRGGGGVVRPYRSPSCSPVSIISESATNAFEWMN